MKKILSSVLLVSMLTAYVGCSDNNETPEAPSIGVPATATNVQVETAVDITFSVISPGGYKSSAVTVVGGTAVIKTEPAAKSTTGDVVVTFTADATEGAGSVTLVVTDQNDKTGNETAVLNKIAESVAEIVVVNGVLSTQTWVASKVYELAGRVIVGSGATLTIEAGTIVKGREGQGINASALMVARGGKLNANGTADKPIVMTSVLDDIQPGQKKGTTLGLNDKGKWGGLVILGKAPVSVSGSTEAQIEGVPASETLGLYGGDVVNDNSGTITYVSIRHGGTVLSGGNEINGLTLGGVGNGTTINNIEIFANVDDGVEFFGGSVNVNNLLVAYQGDDGIDIDQAYSGTIDGFFVVHGGDTDEGLEIDGPEGTANATGKFTVKNGTLKGDPNQPSDASSLADFKSRAQGTVQNVIFTGYTAGKKIKVAASYTAGCTAGPVDAYSNLIANELVFSSVQFTGFGVQVYSSNTSNCATVPAADQTAAEGKITSTTVSGGIPAASTWNWTLASQLSLL